jgi:hypothetical protein
MIYCWNLGSAKPMPIIRTTIFGEPNLMHSSNFIIGLTTKLMYEKLVEISYIDEFVL